MYEVNSIITLNIYIISTTYTYIIFTNYTYIISTDYTYIISTNYTYIISTNYTYIISTNYTLFYYKLLYNSIQYKPISLAHSYWRCRRELHTYPWLMRRSLVYRTTRVVVMTSLPGLYLPYPP